MFEIGKVYSRKNDLHGVYEGQRQGGISTPKGRAFVFLFTGHSGTQYGYRDEYREDGTFWYSGEGQKGDMVMKAGNLAIKEHQIRAKHLYLFENLPRGAVRFVGEFEYLGHHTEQRPDEENNLRSALIFHLGFVPDPNKSYRGTGVALRHIDDQRPVTKALTLRQLRRLAELGFKEGSSLDERLVNVARRAKAVKLYALARAKGKCEGCKADAPFATRTGPYLEVHHLYRLSDGGPDHPDAVIALCPNCHCRAHYSSESNAFNKTLISIVNTIEENIPLEIQ